MALVQTGLYKAANRSPTTPALTPASAAWVRTLRLSCSQNGRTPTTSRNEGVKMAIRHVVGIRPGIPPCATSEDQGQPIPHLYQCCASPFEIALTPRFLNTSYAAIKSDSSLISGQDPKG